MLFNNACNKLGVLLLAASAWIVSATPTHAENARPSPFLTGSLGLNVVPSARMDEPGTVRAGVSTLDPYIHSFAGIQIAAPLYINLRQTAEISGLRDSADRLYPGMDIKLRLARERPRTPEVSVGIQSALGHKRMAGEYLALSKRLGDFDLTAGLGWGRFASAAHLKNPLRVLGSHFSDSRPLDGENANEPSQWFTGKNIGLFAGVEYFTPIEGLSLKFDYGADEYTAEHAAFGYNRPAPWSAGLSYSPADWISAGIAMQGTDKIMGRISLQANPTGWPLREKSYDPPKTYYALHGPEPEPERIDRRPEHDLLLDRIKIDNGTAQADLHLAQTGSAPQQIGRAARAVAPHTGTDIQALEFRLISLGLRGLSVRFMQSDLEHAISLEKQGSPQEIWTNTEFLKAQHKNKNDPKRIIKKSPYPHLWMTQDNQISLAEEDTGILFRSSLIAEARAPELLGLMTLGGAFRLNLGDNLHRLDDARALLPVRGDAGRFADRSIGLDRLYAATTHSLSPEIHTSLTAGYLEEMFAGAGGEIIYRPFRSRFALGAELWQAMKRDPQTSLNLGLTGDMALTGHLNAWYDWPGENVTAYVKAGRYLAGDLGVTAGLEKSFANGAKLEGFVTLTDNADVDLFGGETHAFHGVSLSLPLGGAPYVPDGSTFKFRAEPFGRETGQTLDKPLSLYALTEPFTFDHMARNWAEIVE